VSQQAIDGPGGSTTPAGTGAELTATVKEFALESGFDLVSVTSASEFAEDRDLAIERLQAGLMDGLPWFTESRVIRGTSPQTLLPGARSIICLGLNYYAGEFPPPPALAGRVARYAWSRDYHKVMKKRMKAYVDGLRTRLGTEIAAHWYVDDGPMLDRAAARRAGVGWFGKNTNILTPSLGSWVFLGQVVTDLELEPDQALKKTCGNCVRCIPACPTGAIVSPYILDNSRCISHLTIENRGEIPLEMRPLMQDWVFGCDICQDVCPVNRKASPSSSANLAEGQWAGPLQTEQPEPPKVQGTTPAWLSLVEILEMSEEDFRSRFRGSPILRAKRVGLQRNACVALGNLGDAAAVSALIRALTHGETLVRGHAAWALGCIGTDHCHQALEQAGAVETDDWVLKEIDQARHTAVSSRA